MNDIQFTPAAYDSTIEERLEMLKRDIALLFIEISERLSILESREGEK